MESSVEIFSQRESVVRSYCRTWPVVFDRAVGSWLYDDEGRAFLDFFAGAGALNYGHNNPMLKQALLDYLGGDRIVHALDMYTVAKRDFLQTFEDLVLSPRALDYRVQFPGPGGTNAVEAALKIARKVTGRTEVVAFHGAFHGVTLGALSATASALHRGGAGVPLHDVTRMPYGTDQGRDTTGLSWLEQTLDRGKGTRELPAAVILETVQGEGGINVAADEWLRALAALCRQYEVLLIVDDVQMGCGRTGPFFSFEPAGIVPDIVCLSKSISGSGLPLALTLLRPELDIWKPGEHNGTFRGVSPAMVTGEVALRTYWRDDVLARSTVERGRQVAAVLAQIAENAGRLVEVRGCGLAHGLAFTDGELADKVCAAAFERGLLVETAGPRGEVVKLLPPLTIDDDELTHGLSVLSEAVDAAC